ncbi:caspase family protein [Pseudophaeobacter flagellatus]|uniref:caspase family protein n=1 Tax=Pseudophaeobacter flagellatus TaxID=2899119 RepID=UPI001E5F72A3|nr:caspase domain-containing protein [Pseudophaeobacter flagellatus]MCD9146648.1 caspase family protein [Pseudophaeobacter flagellatus]
MFGLGMIGQAMHVYRRLAVFIIVIFTSCAPLQAKDRIALVIGNASYAHTSPLANPGNDAITMAATLRAAGFSVTRLIDADQTSMKRALLQFGRALRGPAVEAGLLYYAGHGVQLHGENYLVPVNANIASEDEIDFEAINVNSFLQVMNSSNADINIVILDACRNNPFATSARSAARGLAPVDAPKGTLIAYATAPGDVALDGTQANSPYTQALSAAIASGGGRTIEAIFKTARRQVLAATNDQQVPWETSSIIGDFYFHQTPSAPGSAPTTPQQIVAAPAPLSNPVQPLDEEEMARKYDLALRLNSAAAWRIFVKEYQDYPDSVYMALALEALSQLSQGAVATAPTQQPPIRPVTPKLRHWPLPQMRIRDCYDRKFGPAAAPNVQLCVSSLLASQAGNSYVGGNLADNRPETAWIEGERGDGIGQTLRFAFQAPTQINAILLANGYTKSPSVFAKNSRVRALRVQSSTGYDSSVRLLDQGAIQRLNIPALGPVTWITLTLQDVYPGSRYLDTAISEIQFR